MRLTPIASLLATCVAGFAAAQTNHLVGSEYLQLQNSGDSGTRILDFAIHYPAVTAGLAAPMQPRTGGWPVVVFLHGFNLLGHDYVDFGRGLASHGFAVVMLNTARADYIKLDEDARAVPHVLATLNSTPGTFSGGLDLERMGLLGHSMGGGVTGMTLAVSEQYRCGLALAPVFPGPITASLVSVPFGIVVGLGDTVTSWAAHSRPYYEWLGTTSGLRFLYAMDGAANHLNIAGLASSSQSTIALRSLEITAGFFRHFLSGDQFGLEQCLGAAANVDPNLFEVRKQVIVPQTWVSVPAQIGRSVRVSVASMLGMGGLFGAPYSVAGVQTPFGTLYLDPASMFAVAIGPANRDGRIDVQISVPSNPALVGVSVSLQGLGVSVSDPMRLGSALQLTVVQ